VETLRDVWLVAIQPFTGGEWDAGISMRFGAEIMLEEINKHTTLLKGFNLKVLWQDGQCTKEVAAELFMQNLLHDRYTVFAPGMAVGDLDTDRDGAIMTNDVARFNKTWGPTEVFPGVVGLLGPGCSDSSLQVAPTAYQAFFPIVSGSATRPSHHLVWALIWVLRSLA
jgi:ABC-type branched-subunit amino acid transport system substrate-binding protein